MPELNITRGYRDGEALLEADLDNIKTAVTTLNNTTKYDSDNIQSNAVTASKVINGTVTAGLLSSGSITTNKINDLGVTTAKITDGEIETRILADLAVTTAKIADTNVTTAKFDTTARLASAKIAAKQVFTASSASATSLTYGDPETTIVEVTASADARYCLVMLQPYDTTSCGVGLSRSASGSGISMTATIKFYINGVEITSRSMSISRSDDDAFVYILPISCFSFLTSTYVNNGDVITAKISSSRQAGTDAFLTVVGRCTMYVIEL